LKDDDALELGKSAGWSCVTKQITKTKLSMIIMDHQTFYQDEG
jgi:hypothetical protein